MKIKLTKELLNCMFNNKCPRILFDLLDEVERLENIEHPPALKTILDTVRAIPDYKWKRKYEAIAAIKKIYPTTVEDAKIFIDNLDE